VTSLCLAQIRKLTMGWNLNFSQAESNTQERRGILSHQQAERQSIGGALLAAVWVQAGGVSIGEKDRSEYRLGKGIIPA